ncbi:MAG: DNA polymerase III subunit alpha [Vicinamibacterales bacterium]
MYVELHTSSAFSFLRAASLPEPLVERAAMLGYPAVALLDRDGVYGAPRFHKAALAAGLRAIIGAELTLSVAVDHATGRTGHAVRQRDESSRQMGVHPSRQPLAASRSHVSVLVSSPEGYRNLCRLITTMKLRAPKGEGALTLDDLDGHVGGLIALAGRPLLQSDRHGVGGLLDRLVGIFGRTNVYVELQRHLQRDETWDNEMLVSLAEAFRVPIVATNGVRFAGQAERPLHDVLTCIREHTTLAQAGRRLVANAERYLKSPAQMARLFEDLPQAVAASGELADRLGFTMQDLGYRFPAYPVPPGETEASFLRKIADIGARDRYRPYHDRARAQVQRELDLIEKLDLAGYFLIVWDIVNFCRQHDILVQGRGSAANSAVCYSLGITAVDPVGMELLFERFLSEERGEWPDIDLDLPSGDRRERVIQHVYAKYGQHGAAMTANVITYRGKSAAREVGKALNLDPTQIDRLAKVMHNFEFRDADDSLSTNLQTAGVDARHPTVQHFARLWQQMQDLPRHLGQHSGGMVICQGALSSVVPLENASMPGRVVVQWDKEDCADMGLIKVDLLGLGMMSALQDALAIINTQRLAASGYSPRVDLAHLPADDPAVYAMLQTADTIGLFQVESRAQMATLPRLKPACFYDLVVQVAIIRPGPIVGQMVHPYLDRRAGRAPVVYDHPLLEPVLKRTLGVPLFQEQLLRMAMVVAGFTGGQAEDLRRAMGFKRSEKRMKQIEVQLREGMAARGLTGEVADRIVLSIGSFALYGFPESHAASFALIAYASAYLKAHYPAAFYTALLNNQPMGFYHPATLVKDAQRRGVRFAPVDVQASDWDCTVGVDGTIRLGLRFVAGLREDVGRVIAAKGREQERAGQRPREDLGGARPSATSARCPKCGCDDPSMIEVTDDSSVMAGGSSRQPLGHPNAQSPRVGAPVAASRYAFCNVCSHSWTDGAAGRRFRSIDELIRVTGMRRDEVTVLAEIGALNAFGYDRRSALWQVERLVRPAGELFAGDDMSEEPWPGDWERLAASGSRLDLIPDQGLAARGSRLESTEHDSADSVTAESTSRQPPAASRFASPLPEMSAGERLVADYAGTGVTVGPHPMGFRRHALAMKGVLRAIDLPQVRHGRRVRTAGMVITRQRPGTAKGFVFLTLEDETGIANVIVRPDVYARDRAIVVESPFLLVEGILQVQDGVTSIRAERMERLEGLLASMAVESHDFH